MNWTSQASIRFSEGGPLNVGVSIRCIKDGTHMTAHESMLLPLGLKTPCPHTTTKPQNHFYGERWIEPVDITKIFCNFTNINLYIWMSYVR